MARPQPPAAALTWAAEAIGAASPARTVKRLSGGAHAVTHLLRTELPRRELVLRRFLSGDHAASFEARVLDGLQGLDGWAPQLIDADPEGRRFGEPAVLITRLAGHASITPDSPGAAAAQLGCALARVHAHPIAGPTALGGMRHGHHGRAGMGGLRDRMATAVIPSASGAGPAAPFLTAHRHRLVGQPQVLTHYDYWSGNVLWEGGTLTGVVDWSGASRAPRGFDVSWCRLDLVLLHGPHTADVFLTAYQESAGTEVPDLVLWDLFALSNCHQSVESWLVNYHDLGRTDLTPNDLRQRHTTWGAERGNVAGQAYGLPSAIIDNHP